MNIKRMSLFFVAAFLVTLVSIFYASNASADEPAVLFEDLFTDGPESYSGKPYYWLGECKMQIKLTPAPTKSEQVELLWRIHPVPPQEACFRRDIVDKEPSVCGSSEDSSGQAPDLLWSRGTHPKASRKEPI